MKYKELKNVFILGLTAILVSACGADNGGDDDETVNPNVNSPSVPGGNNNNNNNNNNGANTSPTPTPAPSGCTAYASREFYSYSISGSGTGTASTSSNHIVADAKLRVSIEPNPSNSIQNKYTLMAGTAQLVRWKNGSGTVVATKTFPTPSTQSAADYYSYKVGVPVGYKTAPQHLDFSASLSGSYKYSIKLSAIMTDKKCVDFCSPSSAQYAGHCAAYGSGYDSFCNQQGSGFTWTLDYLKNQWYCCDGTQVRTCQQTYCGVGNLSGLSGATWSATVRVETDNTTCIQ